MINNYKTFYDMKKIITLAVVALFATIPTLAQSRYGGIPPRNPYAYENHHHRWGRGYFENDLYFGFRIGPAFSRVSSGDKHLDGGSTTTDLHLGAVVGLGITRSAPVFFETGLSYVGKGGKGNNDINKNYTFDLNYLELPLTFKYIYYMDNGMSIHPFLGGYLAVGVGGKIKNFADRESYDSFGGDADQFKRFDGGLRFGCGVGYNIFYADLCYDLGLANICHDSFDTAQNRTFYFNVGVNF